MRLFALYREAFSHLQRNVWVLAMAMFINRSGSMVLLFTSLYMTQELHFSIGEAGLIMSFYGIGSVLGAYIGGWLTDRMNYFTVMLMALVGCGAALLLMLFTTSPIMIAVIMFTYPLIGDMFRPANSTAIASYSTPENLTRSVSLVRLAVNLGFSVGPAMGGFIALWLGYKWLFVLDAVTSILAAVMLYFFLPKRPPASKRPRAEVSTSVRSTSAYRDYRFLFFIFLVALYGTCFFQLFASVPQFFSHQYHYSEDTIGLLMALNGAIVVLVEMPVVLILEKHKRKFRYMILGSLCLPVAFGILWFNNPALIMSVIYTVAITLSEIFAMPFMMNHALSRAPRGREGQYNALYSMAFGVSTITAPIIGLGVADRFGFNTLFVVLISVSLLMAVLFEWARRWDAKRTTAD